MLLNASFLYTGDKEKSMVKIIYSVSLLLVFLLAGCATTPTPKNKENVGAIFHEYPHWYKAAKKTEKKWGVPVNVQMAIIYYESAFRADARPPRRYYLGIFPGKHITSAYGYAQALDGTWRDYKSTVGSIFASRTKFESASDFIGWYSAQARDRLGIPQNDPYHLYLAYHEGLGGFERRSYLRKPWLMQYAKNVAIKSQIFQNQLAFFEYGTNPSDFPIENLPESKPTDDNELPELEEPSRYYCVLTPTEPDTNENT
jgi:hypothetical protein